jgi:type VI secretion system protein ImpC
MQIDGKLADEVLPFRVLVLGDFSGKGQDPAADDGAYVHDMATDALAERKIGSIPNGVRWQDVLGDLKVNLPISEKDPKLKAFATYVKGTFQGQIAGVVTDTTDDDQAATEIRVSGTVTLSGKRIDESATVPSRETTLPTSNGIGDFTGAIALKATVTVEKADKGVKLPETQAIKLVGLTGSVDRDLVADPNKVSPFLAGDVILGNATVKIDPANNLTINDDATLGQVINGRVTGTAWVRLAIPIRDLASFSPDFLVGYIPEIRRVKLLGAMIDEVRAQILTTPALKTAISKLLPVVDPTTKTFPVYDATKSQLALLREALKGGYPYLEARWKKQPDAKTTDLSKPEAPVDTPAHKIAGDAQTLLLAAYPELVKLTVDGEKKPQATTTTEIVVLQAGPTDDEKSLVLRDQNQYIEDYERFVSNLAALFINLRDDDLPKVTSINTFMAAVDKVRQRIDGQVNEYLTNLYTSEPFQSVERCWRGLNDLCSVAKDPLVVVDVLDVGKKELGDDLTDNSVDLFKSALFKKVYHDEYDRYGGKPFGAMIGLYSFDVAGGGDLPWLQAMGDVANLTHCPFIAAAGPNAFPACRTWDDVDALPSLDTALTHPRYGKWDVFRKTDGAGYVGLTLPGYLLRLPWGAEEGQFGNTMANYNELQKFDTVQDATVEKPVPYTRDDMGRSAGYLYGNSAILFGQNLIRSFQDTGWCQHIRGERGGGYVEGLNVHAVEQGDRLEMQPPLELALPDFKERQLSDHGFIPLIWKKNTTTATFFGARSTKKAIAYAAELDTQNADLVCNLAYSFSVTRIAHYIKALTRPYIGTVADQTYLQNLITNWLGGYVTKIVNPDELTVQRYPFAAIEVDVVKKPGPLGWYSATVSVLPHIQFEGMRVELRLEAALGGAK